MQKDGSAILCIPPGLSALISTTLSPITSMPTKYMPSAGSFLLIASMMPRSTSLIERERASAHADVGPRVVTRGHSPEGGQLPVALEDLSLEQEDPGIAVLSAVDELLNDRIAV